MGRFGQFSGWVLSPSVGGSFQSIFVVGRFSPGSFRPKSIETWGQHVSEISCKATKTMGFLRRNLALAPRHTKEVAYKTLVRPQLEYAAPIWNPYHKLQIQEVEQGCHTPAETKFPDISLTIP